MALKSKSQARFLSGVKPELFKEFASKTLQSIKNLPEKAKRRAKPGT